MPNPINTPQISVLKHHLVLESIKLVKCLIFFWKRMFKKKQQCSSWGIMGLLFRNCVGNAVIPEWNNGFSWLDVI